MWESRGVRAVDVRLNADAKEDKTATKRTAKARTKRKSWLALVMRTKEGAHDAGWNQD